MSGQDMNPDFRITKPADDNESRESNHRCHDDQNLSQCLRFHRNGLRAGGARRWRHDDNLLADRTIDLPARIAGVALDMLAALRAEELEFSHKFYWPQNVPAFDMTRDMMLY
jgi:hypothetical protein